MLRISRRMKTNLFFRKVTFPVRINSLFGKPRPLSRTISSSEYGNSNDSPEIKREFSFPYHSRVDQRSPLSANASKNVERIMERYSNKKPTPGTLEQFIVLSNVKHKLSWGPHVQNEMLVRLTSRIRDFGNLPSKLLEEKQVETVINMYKDYLQQIESLESTDSPKLNREFIRLLSEFKAKDSSTLPLIASGIQSWRESTNQKGIDNILAAQLDDLFTARLSVRILIGQYCEFAKPNMPGLIERGLLVSEVVEEARSKVKQMTIEKYSKCPDITIEGKLDSRLTYIRTFLRHIVVELVKNSAEATLEKHKESDKLPSVDIVISGGKEDCVIKVSDVGGGIPRSALNKIWSYQFTTSKNKVQNAKEMTFRDSFSGSGYGLPIARLFARYFGGDLQLICTEGYGTDAYIYLKRVESSAVEVLPD